MAAAVASQQRGQCFGKFTTRVFALQEFFYRLKPWFSAGQGKLFWGQSANVNNVHNVNWILIRLQTSWDKEKCPSRCKEAIRQSDGCEASLRQSADKADLDRRNGGQIDPAVAGAQVQTLIWTIICHQGSLINCTHTLSVWFPAFQSFLKTSLSVKSVEV